jgi:hypothetical protein
MLGGWRTLEQKESDAQEYSVFTKHLAQSFFSRFPQSGTLGAMYSCLQCPPGRSRKRAISSEAEIGKHCFELARTANRYHHLSNIRTMLTRLQLKLILSC